MTKSQVQKTEIAGKLVEPYFPGNMHIYIKCLIPTQFLDILLSVKRGVALTKKTPKTNPD